MSDAMQAVMAELAALEDQKTGGGSPPESGTVPGPGSHPPACHGETARLFWIVRD